MTSGADNLWGASIERLLVVGLGSIGRRHVSIVRKIFSGIRIAALRRAESSQIEEIGIDYTFMNLGEALAFKPQAAVIATPASHHLDLAVSLARAGVHLLVEKPISCNTTGVADLIEICRQNGVILLVGYNLRFFPSLLHFRALIAAGHVGRVLSVRAEIGQFLPDWRPNVDYRSTVSAVAALGGGVLLELSHEFDYLRWLWGEVAWVSAVQLRQSKLEVDVEDTAYVVVGFEHFDDGPPLVASLNMDFIRHDTTRSCIAVGELGSLRWDALAGTVAVFYKGGAGWCTLKSDPQHRDASYVAEWNHFAKCIANREKPLISGADGLAVLRIIEAARRSSAIRAVVQLRKEPR